MHRRPRNVEIGVRGCSGARAADGVNMSAARDRQGIALIIVLGALALLVLMGVTFSIFMRTERVAAGSFQNDVIARQLLHAALVRALNRIDAETTGIGYPAWDCLLSEGTNNFNAGVASSSAKDWVPSGALGTNTDPRPGWISLTYDSGGKVEGRVGYLVLNCSGLIDVNYAGGAARANGANVEEIQVASLPEVNNETKLLNAAPYNTQQELAAIGTNNGGLVQSPESLVTYSAFHMGRWNGTGIETNLTDISGTANELKGRTAIIPSLKACLGVTDQDAGFIFTNLLDYVDSDSIPRNLASPCTESVPMINELKVTANLKFVGSNCTPSVKVDIEWYYPFVRANPLSFDIEPDIKIVGSDAAFTPPPIPNDPIPADYDNNVNYVHRVQVGSVGGVVTYDASHVGKKVSFTVTVKLRVKHGTDSVDEVPSPWSDTTAIVITTPEITVPGGPWSNGSISAADGKECIDPRFNWDGRLSKGQWVGYSDLAGQPGWTPAWTNGSLDKINNVTQWYWDNTDTCDQHQYCYVADKSLTVVGELSYLLRGVGLARRWATIRIRDESATRPLDRVFDYFVVGAPAFVRKGLVNPNTRQSEIVKALLLDMPLDEYPGAGAPTLKGGALTALNSWWVASDGVSGNVTNLSDLGHMTNWAGVVGMSLTPFQVDALYRNTSGLLGLGQQYFMIILYAQTTKAVEAVGDTVVAGVRGIAEVWRDPYTHRQVIRSYRVINEQ